MKTVCSLLILFLVVTAGFGQKKEIDVFEKKEGSKVIVVARNTGRSGYTVTLKITSKGMDVSPSMNVEAVVPAGYMKEMATLVPRPGENWEYSYQVSFALSTVTTISSPSKPGEEETPPPTTSSTPPQTSSPPSATSLSTADIILYSKPGCSRCAFVKKQLTSQNIAFEEYLTTSNSPEINNMWAQLRNAGFAGGSVTMPVVRANGKYYYNIPDLNGFVTSLKKS